MQRLPVGSTEMIVRCCVIRNPTVPQIRDDLDFCPREGTIPIRLPSGFVVGYVCVGHEAVSLA